MGWAGPSWGRATCLWERENPDLLTSPDTDGGTIPNLKFSFANARNRLLTGGWSREVTVRELPISTTHLNLDDATTAYKGKPSTIK
jgi:oxalate decarboxylase